MLTREEDIDVHALRRQGMSISAIARHLGRDRKTIRAYLAGGRVAGERKPGASRALLEALLHCPLDGNVEPLLQRPRHQGRRRIVGHRLRHALPDQAVAVGVGQEEPLAGRLAQMFLH